MILEMIESETGVPVEKLEQIIRTASHRYKTYQIPKRSGGTREINQPTPQVKYLQRWVVRNIISMLPVHPSVTSYRKGVGIAANAVRHAKQNYLLKIDLQNFFPSISQDDVRRLLAVNAELLSAHGYGTADFDLIVSLVCRFGVLTIGAPSSPAISNAALFEFDRKVSDKCVGSDIIYTRYADDISFSTNVPYVLSELLKYVVRELAALPSPKLRLNDEKTVFTSKKRRRIVTGVVLTPSGSLSIGREKTRAVRTMIHKYQVGELSSPDLEYLKGYLSYARSIDPELIGRLRGKFGEQLVESLLDSAHSDLDQHS